MKNIARLCSIEWFKLKNNKTFLIYIFTYTLVLFALSYASNNITRTVDGQKINILKMSGFLDFPVFWQNITWASGFLKIILVFLVGHIISIEFTNKAFKQNIIDGLSRGEFLISKLFSLGIISLFSTLLVLICGTFIAIATNDLSEVSLFENIHFVGAYFVQLFAFLCFVMLLCFLVRKISLVLVILILWIIAEELITYFIGNSNSIFYMPMGSISHLIEGPMLKIIEITKFFGGNKIYNYIPTETFILTVFYASLFIFSSYKFLKSKDL